MKDRGDLLLKRVLETADDGDANALLKAFEAGYPVEELRQLFYSENPAVVKAGTWIASELGTRITPVLSDLPALLKHPLRYVRFYAVDCVLAAAGEGNGSLIAATINLVDDPESAVRWKVLGFLMWAGEGQLRAALSELEGSALASQVDWFIRNIGASHGTLDSGIQSENPLRRRFAVALAARPGSRKVESLMLAANSQDEAIAGFARDVLSSRH